MQRNLFAVLTLLSAFHVVATCHAEDVTTVFLVRHGEKTDDKQDPELSEAGQKRAKALARTLRSVKLDACFASEFKRTQLTATPTATAAKLEVTERAAGNESLLANELKTNFAGKTVLFVGHSNTVPLLMKHLGVKSIPKIGESDYDNLVILKVGKTGSVTVTRIHYGDANPE